MAGSARSRLRRQSCNTRQCRRRRGSLCRKLLVSRARKLRADWTDDEASSMVVVIDAIVKALDLKNEDFPDGVNVRGPRARGYKAGRIAAG